jgi:two-component sensor histidine kinase
MLMTFAPFVDPVTSLARAMVETSDTPLLLLDGDLAVIAVSDSFCRDFGIDPAAVVGASILEMGNGEWNLSRLKSLLTATSTGGADIDKYEMDLAAPDGGGTRCLELSAHKLDYAGSDDILLLLSVADRTEARASAKESKALIANNVLLMQELQHRVANSLQIIASVLMQSARRVSDNETRGHLEMAQNRVLSIAAIQKQLSQTGVDYVALRPYLTQLCQSIGASMIADPSRLSIEVEVEDIKVGSAASVSLGLIVTELVINSLKHAYPANCGGKIFVRYKTDGDGWTLEIEDDGVGMPVRKPVAVAGLGTSIVEALARQLRARIVMADARTGTSVSIVHEASGTPGSNIMPLVKAV